MVADSSSHDSATTENDGDGEILGETQGKRRDATWPLGVYVLLLATKRLIVNANFFTKLVCDYAVAIVVVCKDIPTLSLVAYISRCWT